MASFSKLFLASSVLASVALAAPMNQARAVVYDIVTETVWTTLDVTSTVWDNGAPAMSSTSATTVSATQMATTQVASTPTATMVSSTMAPSVATVAAPISTPSTTTAMTSTWTSTSLTSAAASTSAASAAITSRTVPQAPSAVANAPMSASSDGTCQGTGAACVGDVTHWDGGLGACGTNVDTTTDLAIALPFAFMGTESNDNPYCGQSVTLYSPSTGTTVQATVRDKCMGCVDRAIDCTDALFDAITDNMGNGRMSGIEWWFT